MWHYCNILSWCSTIFLQIHSKGIRHNSWGFTSLRPSHIFGLNQETFSEEKCIWNSSATWQPFCLDHVLKPWDPTFWPQLSRQPALTLFWTGLKILGHFFRLLVCCGCRSVNIALCWHLFVWSLHIYCVEDFFAGQQYDELDKAQLPHECKIRGSSVLSKCK